MITRFDGDYQFLSNFYPSPITWECKTYPTVEHAYQANKTLNSAFHHFVIKAKTPALAKSLGRSITPRPDWERIKYWLMYELLSRKFEPGSDLAKKLIATYPLALVEGNHWHDNVWGVCSCTKCESQGLNHLGRQLLCIRRTLMVEMW